MVFFLASLLARVAAACQYLSPNALEKRTHDALS